MPKNRRTIIPFIVIASLIVAALFFYTLHKPVSATEPLKAVPVNALIAIRVNNFRALYEKTMADNHIWNELIAIPGFGRINSQLRFLDSLFRYVPEAKDILQTSPSFISVHATGKDKISILHAIQLPPRYSEKSVNEMITGLVGNRGIISSRKYEGAVIHEAVLKFGQGVRDFAWAVSRDILMISFSTIVLEDAIRQMNSGESLITLKGFPEIYSTAGKNVDAKCVYEFLPLSARIVFSGENRIQGQDKISQQFCQLGRDGFESAIGHAAYEWVCKSPRFRLIHSYPVYPTGTPEITADQVLPGSVASFVSLGISDVTSYFEAYKSYLQGLGKLTSYNNTLRTLNETYQTDLPGLFRDIMDNEITLAYDTPVSQDDSSRLFVLLRVKSQGLAETRMKDLLVKSAAVESKPMTSYTVEYRLDNEVTFKIHRLPIDNLTAGIFGSLFSGLKEHYFTFVDNYLVFGSSVASIRSLIHNQVLNKTLENEAAYKEFKNNLSPRSNILFYSNLSKSQAVFTPFLKNEIGNKWKKYETVFQKVPVTGFQLFSNNNMLYSNFLVKYLSSYNLETHTVWESKLDTLADGKPVFVANHQTKQNEVFVQDLNHKIYLINQVGRILWKVQLPEPINSEIYQVDYFRNGKLQLLFSARDYLYMIDRNGNFVEKYPVKLRSPATCGVSVFDYDNNRDYRLFIACEDKRIYAYTKEGSLVDGWSFGQSESEVNQPVNHFRAGDKDFLVFGDRYRTYILDRKGNTRISTDTFFPRSVRNNYYLHIPHDGSGAGIVTTDTTGMVYFILFNGQVRTVELDHFTGNHFFDYRDLTGDGEMEFIFIDQNKLSVYSANKTRKFAYTFNESIDIRPVFYQFSSGDRKLGVVCRNENLIYLFNSDGKLYDGFPLQGNTPFSIGYFGNSLSRFNLVVGSKDNFLYNYRVR